MPKETGHPAETRERKPPRPNIEEFSQLDPLRIGETLGWPNTSITNRGDVTDWHFAGPVSLSITRTERGDHIFGTAEVMRIIDGKMIAQAVSYGITSIEFNKTQKQVIFRTKEKSSLFIKGSGQVHGAADVFISPQITD